MSAEANLEQQWVRLPRQWRFGLKLWRGLGIVCVMVALWGGYALTGQPVTLVINGQAHQIRTHRLTVEAVLRGLDLPLETKDIVQPSLDTPLLSEQTTITVELARPVLIEADGRTLQRFSHEQTAAGILAEAGIIVNPRDEILLNGVVVPDPDAPLPLSANPKPVSPNDSQRLWSGTPRGAIASHRPQPVQLILHRAIPVTLNDGGARSTFYTTRPNVGEALLEQGLALFLGDEVTPSLGTRLSPGMRIYIQRSVPVNIFADGRTIKTRTRRETVAELLAEAGVALMGQDYSRPPLDHPISSDETIEVVRVKETFEIQQEFIPFETQWLPDPEMELDSQAVRQEGNTGVVKSRTRVRYENGQEVWRELEDEWLDQEPRNREIAYGTNIVVRTLETDSGPIEYWRKIPMVITGYSAATAGKDPSHPRYGITRSGLPLRRGMVAVDPKVIPLMTELYVPAYGQALAADTGGLIQGKHIDLAFEEDQLPENLYEWRDVYVLTPVPPAEEIRFVLPQWPQR